MDKFNEPIAIVGMGCRLPGSSSNPEKLWNLLIAKQSARKQIPPERFNIDAFYHPDADRNGTLNVRHGHFLDEDVSAFDASFFSISPVEALSMDPMQRMLLEVTYEALENAGIPLSKISGSDTGCYIGCFTSDYDQIQKRDPETLPKYHATGTGQAILSNRLSFFFNLKGPSVTIDTACSSSLVALHLACQSLRTSEAKIAIVGASHMLLNPDVMIGMTNLHFLSPDSICYTFDSRANGYARGEGIASIVLKPLGDAIKDGDTIRAIIRGTATNSVGSNTGITVPSKEAQIRLIQSAYLRAGCDPALTGYCEAHGTGTKVGDPIEASAIGEALASRRREGKRGKLFVGSIKTNIGHLEGASGLAGLIKVVLSLEKGLIAPNLWFEQWNPDIDSESWNIRVPTELTPWSSSGLRRASLNSFGYGGANAHVILDDAYHFMRSRDLQGNHKTSAFPEHREDRDKDRALGNLDDSSSAPTVLDTDTHPSITDTSKQTNVHMLPQNPRIFCLTAHGPASVSRMARSYADHLASLEFDDEGHLLDNLAFTLADRRTKHEYGSAFVASSVKQLVQELESPLNVVQSRVKECQIGFVFTGQGAQWWAMGRELLEWPVFSRSLEACNNAVQSFGASWNLVDELLKDQKSSRVNEAEISQPLCSALQIALVDLYASWRILPDKVTGHSSGEIAAAYATGALTLESAMLVAYHRGILSTKVKTLGYSGGMMAVSMSEDRAVEEIEGLGDGSGKISVACVNSPNSVTVSGDVAAIDKLQSILVSQKIFARKLQVQTAYHSHHMHAISEEYRTCLDHLEAVPWEERKPVKMYSSVLGREIISTDDLSARYWVENLVSCVRFSDALISLMQVDEKPADILIEFGPHSALEGPVKQVLSSISEATSEMHQTRYLSVLVRHKVQRSAAVTALSTAAFVYLKGYPVDMHSANFPHRVSTSRYSVLTDLPAYSWNHSSKHWSESRISHDHRFRRFARTDILGAPSNDWNHYEPRWRNFVRLAEQPWVRGHIVQGAIVYPAAGFCCMALQAVSQMSMLATEYAQVEEFKIRDLRVINALVVPETDEGVEISFSMRPTSENAPGLRYEFQVYSYNRHAGWTKHCSGLVLAVYRNYDVSISKRQNHIRDSRRAHISDTASISSQKFYQGLDSVGLTYGPEFQGIENLSTGSGRAFGTVKVTDTASIMPLKFESPCLIHPATMDTFLQLSIAAVTEGETRMLTQPYVPTFLQELTLSGSFRHQGFQVAAESELHAFRDLHSRVWAIGDDNTSFVELKGIKLVAIAQNAVTQRTSSVPSHTALVVWEPDVDMMLPAELNNILQRSASTTKYQSRLRDFELLAYYFFDKVLNEVGETEVLGMHRHHQQFFRYMRRQRELVQNEMHEQQTPDWSKLENSTVSSRIRGLIKEFDHESDYEGTMFVRMGRALTSVLRKEIEPLDLMMKDNLLYNYYTVALGTQGTYPQVQKYVSLLSHKYPNLDYLEIGAGTGGCTAPVLEALEGTQHRRYPRMRSYTYTDVSSAFFEKAKDRFANWSSMMKFTKLDIEQDPSKQAGFENQKFDVIVAANVLHATFDISKTIKHTRKLLRPGGKLIILDMTHSMQSVSLIFGNLPGWWNCSEHWRDYGPLLSEEQWRDTLTKNGFTDLEVSSPDTTNHLDEQTRLIVAGALEPTAKGDEISRKRVLILRPCSCSSVCQDLITEQVDRLRDANCAVKLSKLHEVRETNLTGVAILSFLEYEKSLLKDISSEDLSALQDLVQRSMGLIWVTRGGNSIKAPLPELSLFHGLARSLRAEIEGYTCITVDLDAHKVLSAENASSLLLRLIEACFGYPNRQTLGVTDREFCELNGIVHIKRAVENSGLNRQIAIRRNLIPVQPESKKLSQLDLPIKVRFGTAEEPTSLFFEEDIWITSSQLPRDCVQVEVHATGLSPKATVGLQGDSKDVSFGQELAGIVRRTGSGVSDIAIGDRVVAYCSNSLATHIRVPKDYVQKIPDVMSFTAAATLPVAYIVAYYALTMVARIQKQDSVLIHSATNPVSQAAMQVAKLYGAKVYATVDSESSKHMLATRYKIPTNQIFLIQNANLEESIRRLTCDRGVDIALCSLAGDARGGVIDLVRPLGHFIEIVESDSNPTRINPSSKSLIYAPISTRDIFQQNSTSIVGLFANVMGLVRAGKLGELSPLPKHSFSDVQELFSPAQRQSSAGGIVLEPHPEDLLPFMERDRSELLLPTDATYLLAGGFGGLGRSVARWMVKRGARNILFVSRSGVKSIEAQTLLRYLDSARVHFKVIECDITDESKLSRLLSNALTDMPPIRGVIQGAMVLKDQTFLNMSHHAFMSCLQPKVQGSWCLHTTTLQQPLDFFLLLSSCASFWGNAGQANYAAGCAYQVALAAYRRSLGLPATAIDLGKVADVGFVAENTGTKSERNLLKLGLLNITEKELLYILETAMLPSSDETDTHMPNGHLLTGVSSSNDPDKGEELPFWSRDPVFSHMDFTRPQLRVSNQDCDIKESTEAQKQLPLFELLRSTKSISKNKDCILEALQRKLARALLMPLEDIDATKPMSLYGMDSLVAVELRNWFLRDARIDLPVFEILQAPSLTSLAERVVERLTRE